MRHGARKSYLTSLRDQIASLRVVKCRMAHERVVAARGTERPAVGRGALTVLQRVGLCTPDERNERLGCSHTMSRTKLDRAINELGPEAAGRLGRELNWLTNEIHLLDHRKGEAEARLAAARREAEGGRRGLSTPGLVDESGEVGRLERQHDEYVERVAALRDEVVLEIEKMLGRLE